MRRGGDKHEFNEDNAHLHKVEEQWKKDPPSRSKVGSNGAKRKTYQKPPAKNLRFFPTNSEKEKNNISKSLPKTKKAKKGLRERKTSTPKTTRKLTTEKQPDFGNSFDEFEQEATKNLITDEQPDFDEISDECEEM